jgi:hypothetical protein
MPSKSQRRRNRALKKSNLVKTTNTYVPPGATDESVSLEEYDVVPSDEDEYVPLTRDEYVPHVGVNEYVPRVGVNDDTKYVKNIDMKYLMDNIKRLNPSRIIFI